jgi:hypothetical protein
MICKFVTETMSWNPEDEKFGKEKSGKISNILITKQKR